jgi:hypothetical protein
MFEEMIKRSPSKEHKLSEIVQQILVSMQHYSFHKEILKIMRAVSELAQQMTWPNLKGDRFPFSIEDMFDIRYLLITIVMAVSTVGTAVVMFST